MLPELQKATATSGAYSFLEMRFGIWARSYASFCYLLTQIARMGSILYLLALPMNALLGWDIKMIIIITGIVIILYSMLGGLKAVIWTEAIQGFILICGALICMLILLFDMPEGPKQTFDIAMAELWHRPELRAALSDSQEWKGSQILCSLRRISIHTGFNGVFYDRYCFVCIL